MATKDETPIPAEGTPVEGTPAAKPKEPVVAKPAVEGTPVETTPKGEPKRVRLSDADDEIPTDFEGLVEMSSKTLAKRLNAAKKSEVRQLYEKYGVKNAEELQAKLTRAKELEDEDAARKRETMTTTQKLESDLKKEKELRVESDRRALRVTENYVIDKQENRITKLAGKYLDGDYIDVILPKFAVHLRKNYDETQLKGIKDSDIEEFFKGYAEKHPKLARESKSERKKIPLTNGARTGNRPQAGENQNSGKAGTRSFAPSAENAMDRNEARAEAAKLGYRWIINENLEPIPEFCSASTHTWWSHSGRGGYSP